MSVNNQPNEPVDLGDGETFLGKGWDTTAKVVKENQGASKWVNLEDGQKTEFNIIGIPEVFTKQFPGRDEPTVRVKVAVYTPALESEQVWEMSKKVWEKQLTRQRQKHADKFEDAVFELEREGTGKKTEYYLDYVRQLKPEEIAKRDSLITPDLSKASTKEDDIPF